VLDGGTGGRLKLRATAIALAAGICVAMEMRPYLDDGLTIIGVLGIDDDLQVHPFFFHNTLQSYSIAVRERIVRLWNSKEIQTLEVDPEIVRVEYLEFTNYMGGRI
jgi:hypothetical protein